MDEKLKKVFESKILVRILYGVGIFIVIMLIFSAGINVGFRKASFGKSWGENYNENFGMGRRGTPPSNIGQNWMNGMMGYFPNAHGAIGKIMKLELPSIIMTDKDNIEKSILTKNDTKVEKVREKIKITDLKVDDFIVVIGSPNTQGQIEAKLIRLMPSPPPGFSPAATSSPSNS